MARHLENVSHNVRIRREAMGLSQAELAKLARKTNRFISMIETAPKDVRLSTLEDLAEALSCTIIDLLGPVKDARRLAPPSKRTKTLEIPKTANVGLDLAVKLLNQARKQAKK